MIRFLKNAAQKLGVKCMRAEKCHDEVESEALAMSCESLNPRFLAMVKRCKANRGI